MENIFSASCQEYPESKTSDNSVKTGDSQKFCNAYLKSKGLDKFYEVFSATENCLLLDIDSRELPGQYFFGLEMLKKLDPKIENNKYFYRSRHGNIHVIIWLEQPMPIYQRIAWQSILGSDPKREALHMTHVDNGNMSPILLYMRKNRKPVTKFEDLEA